ncbi:MAG: ABC transporter substrate-binding protein [Betaproteobacteria bacterium]|jgi:branched-chain amino acid transport system substrate-binding protein|nr:ABC transporter substrate-binding protein [Betaproteobacteria bacterium]
MKSFKFNFSIVAAASLFALAFPVSSFSAEKELLLGINDALTGPGAVYGLPQANAVQMAIEEINARGGIKAGADNYKLKAVSNDDKANPTEATNSVRKLIDRDNVKYLVGFCCSGSTSAVASFIAKENVVMLVGNAAERAITAAGTPNLFRTRPPADFTGAAAGTFVAKRGAKNIAVIGSLDVSFYTQYLDAFEREIVKAGGKIVAKETFGLKDRDMTPQLTKVKALNPDALLVLGYVEPAAFVYRQSVELGMKLPRYGFTSGSEEQFLKVASSDQMEGVWDLRPTELTIEALDANAKTYVANYTKKFGTPPSPSSPYAYDQVYVLKNAIEKAGGAEDIKKVMNEIGKISVPKEAVMKYLPTDGTMFDVNGQAYTSNGAFQWQKGKWIYVSDLPSDTKTYSSFLRSLRK